MPHINVFNAYKELGVHRESTDAEIKSVYRTLAMKLHPDRPGSDEGQFLRVSQAYNLLKGVARLHTLDELRLRGDVCMNCDSLGVKRKQKRFTHVEISSCNHCGGCGYVPRK